MITFAIKQKILCVCMILLILFSITSPNSKVQADTIPPGVAETYRNNIVSQASSYLGVPYVFGGMSSSGVDCSGLALLVYRNAGFIAWDSYAHNTYSIHTSLVNAGCSGSSSPQHKGCVFFSNSYSHMGVYVGDGMIIHAPGSDQTVCCVSAGSGKTYFKPVAWMY